MCSRGKGGEEEREHDGGLRRGRTERACCGTVRFGCYGRVFRGKPEVGLSDELEAAQILFAPANIIK